MCDPREATVIAERVLHSLQAPFVIDGRELFIGASIGIALATAKSAPEQVMRDADVAMYRAKADGKGRHAVFDAAMHEQVMRRLDLEGELRSAIETRALEVVYQPIVQAATGRIVGFEALLPLAERRAGRGPGDGRRDGPGRSRSAARSSRPRARSSRSGASCRAAPA